MSETQIEELERRASILIDKEHPCVSRAEFTPTAVYIDLGVDTGISIEPTTGRIRVLHHGDAFYRVEEIVMIHDEEKVAEVLKILRLRTVMDEIADV